VIHEVLDSARDVADGSLAALAYYPLPSNF
jgi:hypothetical protein